MLRSTHLPEVSASARPHNLPYMDYLANERPAIRVNTHWQTIGSASSETTRDANWLYRLTGNEKDHGVRTVTSLIMCNLAD